MPQSSQQCIQEAKRVSGRLASQDIPGQIWAWADLEHHAQHGPVDDLCACLRTVGELFADMEEDVVALTLWQRVLKCMERLLAALCDVLGFSVGEIGRIIVADSEMRKNFEIMAKALENRAQEKLTAVNTF